MNMIRNNVQLIGNVGQNPEIKTLESGKKVAHFSIACSDSYNDKEGNKVETTQWFNCTAWEGLATILEKYVTKGKQIAVSGKLINRTWTEKGANSSKRTHHSTEILVSDILLLGNNHTD